MLREYEFTVITRPDLSEEDNKKALARYEEILLRDGGEIIEKEIWNNYRMSYPIKKFFRAHYAFYDFATKKENIAEVERVIRFDENVLRYLNVKLADSVEPEKRRADLKKAKLLAEERARAAEAAESADD